MQNKFVFNFIEKIYQLPDVKIKKKKKEKNKKRTGHRLDVGKTGKKTVYKKSNI